MARWGMGVAAAALVAGAAVVTGSHSVPEPTPGSGVSPTTAIRAGGRVGYVNLPRIHREYRKAQKRAGELTAARKQAEEKVAALRAKYAEAQREVMAVQEPVKREQRTRELIELVRQIEDATAAAVREAKPQADAALRELFGEVREAVAAVAKEHGLDAVHAYPGDPDTDQSAEMEYILKTPALAPLYLAPSADYTDRVLKRLNDKSDADK